jgi:hypothetical protein
LGALLATGCPSTDEDPSDDGSDTDTDTPADTDDTDVPIVYDCGAFTEAPPNWVLSPGLRAVVIADATDGLQQPVALVFGGGVFGGLLYVVDQTAQTVWSIDVTTGATTAFAPPTVFPSPPTLLAAITWDAEGVFDGNLYLSETVNTADQTNILWRLDPTGAPTVLAAGPGPALDEVYAMAFAPVGAAVQGLFVSGDTDGAYVDWAIYDVAGVGTPFSEVPGAEGMCFDPSGAYGEGPIAALAQGGGFSGDGSITEIGFDGLAQTPIVSGLGGVHANVLAPPGLFDGQMVAASWSTGEVFRVDVDGDITTIATGLQLTEYDANILAVSPDGRVLMVADRLAGQVVCIEED